MWADLGSNFSVDSKGWSARDLIHTIESRRHALPPVHFYLYDAPLLPASIADELRKLDQCKTAEKLYQYGGSYWFLRSLLNHSWRVSDPDLADVLVIPSLREYQSAHVFGRAPASEFCPLLTPMERMMRAIVQTKSWRTRERDHLYVNLDWRYAVPLGKYACQPRDPSRASIPFFGVHPNNESWAKCSGELRPTSSMRAFVETRWSEPMLREFLPRSRGGRTYDFLISAPYVDNGDSFAAGELKQQWGEEALDVFGFRGVHHTIHHAETHPPRARKRRDSARNVTVFFGGRTSTRIGPGRQGMGYYVRWGVMRQWRRAMPHMATLTGPSVEEALERHTERSTLFRDMMIIDSDREKERPAVDACTVNATEVRAATVERMPLAYQRAAISPKTGQETLHHPCLPWCTSHDINAATRGGCLGRYLPSSALSRARFALCLRGDIPSSPRPYDAVRYGAVPIIVSKHVWRVGMPFQCWVPWHHFTIGINEASFLADAGSALHNATVGVDGATEARMRDVMAFYRRDLLWRHPESRVAENLLREASRWKSRGTPDGACLLPDEIKE